MLTPGNFASLSIILGQNPVPLYLAVCVHACEHVYVCTRASTCVCALVTCTALGVQGALTSAEMLSGPSLSQLS